MHGFLFCFLFSFPQTEVTSPTDSEDRTPGRLQAVWPPPKPKDEDEKVGLKYTEAGEKFKLVALSVCTSKTRNADGGTRQSSFKVAHLTLIGFVDKGRVRSSTIVIFSVFCTEICRTHYRVGLCGENKLKMYV